MANATSLCVQFIQQWATLHCRLSRWFQVTVFFQPGSLCYPHGLSVFFCYLALTGHRATLIMVNPTQKGLGSWTVLSRRLLCFFCSWTWTDTWAEDLGPLIQAVLPLSVLVAGLWADLLSPICSGSDLVKVFHDQNVSLAYGSKEIILIVITGMISGPAYSSNRGMSGVFRKQSSRVIFIPSFPNVRPSILQVCRVDRSMHVTENICWVVLAWSPS